MTLISILSALSFLGLALIIGLKNFIQLTDISENLLLIGLSLLAGIFLKIALKKRTSEYKEQTELISERKLEKEVLEEKNEQLEQKIKTLEVALEKLSS